MFRSDLVYPLQDLKGLDESANLDRLGSMLEQNWAVCSITDLALVFACFCSSGMAARQFHVR